MKYLIQLPEPCHEPWEQMTPAENGRYCTQCSKTVVDFTGWTNEDILQHLRTSTGRVCGRLRHTQINTPVSAEGFTLSVYNSALSFTRKIAAIVLFAFGVIQSGCGPSPHTDYHAGVPTIIDTAPKQKVDTSTTLMGKVAVPPPPDTMPKQDKRHKHRKKIEELNTIRPEPEINPEYTTGVIVIHPMEFAKPPDTPTAHH